LGAGRVITGSVRNSDATPAMNVLVAAGQWRGKATLGLATFTKTDGTFELRDAPLDSFELTVTGPARQREVKTVEPSPSTSVGFVLSDIPTGRQAQPGPQLRAGDPAPNLTLTTIDGKTVHTVDPDGKLMLLDFWATWCGPCVAEMPDVIALQKRYADSTDLVILGVSLDWDLTILREFIGKRGITWPQIAGDSAEQAGDRFGVVGIPMMFAISGDGKVLATDLQGSTLEKRIEELLKSHRTPNK
jgi:thiol-disulfide isomerase/thioredoxin